MKSIKKYWLLKKDFIEVGFLSRNKLTGLEFYQEVNSLFFYLQNLENFYV